MGRIGATLPLADPSDGVPMWDPAGFCKDGKQETFDNFREAEVKHGRVAMIAVVGLVTQHYLKFPAIVTPEGNIPLGDSAPSGIFAITQYPGSMGFGVLVLLAGFLELAFSSRQRAPSRGSSATRSTGARLWNPTRSTTTPWRPTRSNTGALPCWGSSGP